MKKLFALLVSVVVFCGTSFALDLNKATQAELEALKGIGEVKAKAIIDYRTKNGAFKSADDLDKVKGVGKGIIAKIGGDLTIDGKPLGMPTGGGEKAMEKKADKAKKAEVASAAEAAMGDKEEKKSSKAKKSEEAAPAAAAAAAPADSKEVKKEKKKKGSDKEG
jgi:competence protein ComEA